MIPCPFHLLTGYDCPFCGGQRLLVALFHGDIVSAFSFNPVLFCLLPYFVLVTAGAFSKRVRRWKLTEKCYSNHAIFAVVAICIVWGVVRNII